MPEFENPPVIEVVLGVQFDKLEKFSNAHLGVFWKELDSNWSDIDDQPPLKPSFETFEEKDRFKQFQLKMTQDVSSRLRIRDPERGRMIQIQNGRFHYNWLGEFGGEYPNYKTLKPEFDDKLRLFQEFIEEEEIGEFDYNQWEVTYVNHIEQGELWEHTEDWASIFENIPAPDSKSDDIELEGIGGAWHFEIKPELGRLHVEINNARGDASEEENPKELLQMKLTARGPVGEDKLTLEEGLETGHEIIVSSFVELTSEEAHEFWGIQNENG